MIFSADSVRQLYLNKDRSVSEKLIEKVEKLGAKAIMFTVDVCWQSKRTLDVRSKSTPRTSAAPSSPKSVSQAISGYQDTNLTWADIPFIRVSDCPLWHYLHLIYVDLTNCGSVIPNCPSS